MAREEQRQRDRDHYLRVTVPLLKAVERQRQVDRVKWAEREAGKPSPLQQWLWARKDRWRIIRQLHKTMRAAPTPEVATATADALFQHFRWIVNLPTPSVLRSYIYWDGGTVHNEVTHRCGCGHFFLCAVLELALLVAKRCGICGIQHKKVLCLLHR